MEQGSAAGLQPFIKHILISAIIVVFTGLNILGSKAVGEAEEWIVVVKVGILLLFLVLGLGRVDLSNLSPATWAPTFRLITGGMIIFVAYEGFELIANAASDMQNPEKNIPRSYFIAVGFVVLLYVLIAVVTMGVLSVPAVVQAKDYALAVANLFDLSSIAMMGSAGFIIVFAAVNAANLRLFRRTSSRRWLPLLGTLGCAAALVLLLLQIALENPRRIAIPAAMLLLSFLVEIVYRRLSGRTLKRALRGEADEGPSSRSA